MTADQLERFRAKFTISDQSCCWVWTASLMTTGYGQFRSLTLPSALAHRSSYEHYVGPIADGCEIDHLCRNILCVNPQHLEAVPHRVNVLRGRAGSRTRERNITGWSERRDALCQAMRAAWAKHVPTEAEIERRKLGNIASAAKRKGFKHSEAMKERLRAAWARRKARVA